MLPKPFCKEWNCHNNTLEYVEWYGGKRIIGYYLLEDKNTCEYLAILHSVVHTFDNKLIDITPFADGRFYNMFCICKNQTLDYSLSEITSYKTSDAKLDITNSSFKKHESLTVSKL